MTTTALVPTGTNSLVVAMAQRYGLQPDKFLATIKSTVFPATPPATNEQLAAFLTVAKQYDLNPFIKEIYAFPSKGGIVPIVSIDGWCALINRQPALDGIEFDDKLDEKGKLVSVTCRIFRKDRNRAISVTEYMQECVRSTDPWSKYPFRMLRHKALIQCARYAFALSGIYDPDEAERIAESGEKIVYYDTPGEKATLVTAKLKQFNAAKTGTVIAAESPVQASQPPDAPVTPTQAPETPQEPTVAQEQASQAASAKPESPELEIVPQEVFVTDVEARTKLGKSYMLLNCRIRENGMEGDLALLCWHKNTMFEHLKRSIDKHCVFGIVRHEKQDTIWWNIESIERIGDVMFEGGNPLASPKDLFAQK